MEEESNVEESNGKFLDTLSKWKNLCIRGLRILTNSYNTALTTKQVARKVLFPACLIEHILISPIEMT